MGGGEEGRERIRERDGLVDLVTEAEGEEVPVHNVQLIHYQPFHAWPRKSSVSGTAGWSPPPNGAGPPSDWILFVAPSVSFGG